MRQKYLTKMKTPNDRTWLALRYAEGFLHAAMLVDKKRRMVLVQRALDILEEAIRGDNLYMLDIPQQGPEEE